MSKDSKEKNKKQENYIATDRNTDAKLHFVADETEVIQRLEQITQRGEWTIEQVEKKKVEKDDAKTNNRPSEHRGCRVSDRKPK